MNAPEILKDLAIIGFSAHRIHDALEIRPLKPYAHHGSLEEFAPTLLRHKAEIMAYLRRAAWLDVKRLAWDFQLRLRRMPGVGLVPQAPKNWTRADWAFAFDALMALTPLTPEEIAELEAIRRRPCSR